MLRAQAIMTISGRASRLSSSGISGFGQDSRTTITRWYSLTVSLRQQTITDASQSSLRNAEPINGENNGSKRIIYEASEGRIVREVPVSFSQLHRKYGLMYKKEEMLLFQEHDPMAEL